MHPSLFITLPSSHPISVMVMLSQSTIRFDEANNITTLLAKNDLVKTNSFVSTIAVYV